MSLNMKPLQGLFTAVAVLLFVAAVGFGSCLVGGTLGAAIDERAGNGGGNEAYTMVLGLGAWLAAIIGAIVVASRYLQKRGDN